MGQAEVGLLNDSIWVGEEEWSRQEEQEQRLLSPRPLLFPRGRIGRSLFGPGAVWEVTGWVCR